MRPTSIEKLSEIKAATARGGARPGSGRKPRALRFARQVARVERKLVAVMPEMVDALIAAARKGDSKQDRAERDPLGG